jgi:hypothetical protein
VGGGTNAFFEERNRDRDRDRDRDAELSVDEPLLMINEGPREGVTTQPAQQNIQTNHSICSQACIRCQQTRRIVIRGEWRRNYAGT